MVFMGFVMRLTMQKKKHLQMVILKKKKHYQCDCEFRDHLYKYHVSNINLVKKKTLSWIIGIVLIICENIIYMNMGSSSLLQLYFY